jgi:hypothetical protein
VLAPHRREARLGLGQPVAGEVGLGTLALKHGGRIAAQGGEQPGQRYPVQSVDVLLLVGVPVAQLVDIVLPHAIHSTTACRAR